MSEPKQKDYRYAGLLGKLTFMNDMRSEGHTLAEADRLWAERFEPVPIDNVIYGVDFGGKPPDR